MEKILFNTGSVEASPAVQTLDKLIQLSLLTFVAFSMFSISVTQISFAIGALSWLLKVHLTQTWKEMKGTWVGIAILCFCLTGVLAIITSVDLESSIKHQKKFVQFLIFFWVANTVQDDKQRDLLVRLLIIAGAIASLVGLSPYLVEKFSHVGRLKGTLSKEATFAGVLMLTGLMTLGRGLFHKPREKLSKEATFAGVLTLTGLMTLGRGLFHKLRENWIFWSLGIICLTLLLTLTRQAWLGFFFGTVFLLFYWNKKYLFIIPLLFATLLMFSPESIKSRLISFKNLDDGALLPRTATWKGGWEIFKDHPVTGCGFKCVDSIYSQYPDPTGYIVELRGMHNNIFQLLVDTGIVGLGTWLSIWAAFFIEVFKRWKALALEKSQDNAAGILMGVSAAVLAFIVGGCFESSLYDSEVAMLLYFLMGLSLTTTKNSQRLNSS
ncbi:MAG: O-antigen ligase family protein [Nitrospinae bacterium]|nr:O-antigen ligase family protein [Nitrospinota bacterium]